MTTTTVSVPAGTHTIVHIGWSEELDRWMVTTRTIAGGTTRRPRQYRSLERAMQLAGRRRGPGVHFVLSATRAQRDEIRAVRASRMAAA